MKNLKFTALFLAAIMMLASCGTMNNTGKGALIGGGGGAAAPVRHAGLSGRDAAVHPVHLHGQHRAAAVCQRDAPRLPAACIYRFTGFYLYIAV